MSFNFGHVVSDGIQAQLSCGQSVIEVDLPSQFCYHIFF